MDKLLAIGQLTGPYKLSGALKVKWIERFDHNQLYEIVCFVKTSKQYRPVFITSCEDYFKFSAVTFKDYNHINKVNGFINATLYCNASQIKLFAQKVPSLVGYDVFLENKIYGSVVEMVDNPAHSLVRIKSIDDRTFLLPMVDAYVIKVDYDNKQLIIRQAL